MKELMNFYSEGAISSGSEGATVKEAVVVKDLQAVVVKEL